MGCRIERHGANDRVFKVWLTSPAQRYKPWWAGGYRSEFYAARAWARQMEVDTVIREGVHAAGCTLPDD